MYLHLASISLASLSRFVSCFIVFRRTFVSFCSDVDLKELRREKEREKKRKAELEVCLYSGLKELIPHDASPALYIY